MLDGGDGPRLGGAPRRAWLRRLQVSWLPVFLVVLDIFLLIISALLALVLLPVLVVVLALLAFLRWLASLITGGRWPTPRDRAVAAQRGPAGAALLTSEQREELAKRYRPVIIAFSEEPSLGPPYRTDEIAAFVGADYHPRSVHLLLDHARLRQGRFQWLPEMPDLTSPRVLREFLGSPDEASSSLEIPWLHGGNPLRIVRHLFPFGRQFRAHWAIPVPKSDCGCSIEAWNRYCGLLQADSERGEEARYGHTIYARVVEGRELPEIGPQSPLSGAVAIQYWWFMFYNDAWNRHQGDWESITVFVVPEAGDMTPIGAAFASHDLGRWRRWDDVHRIDDAGNESSDSTHPRVFMARGSHASYFDYNATGYHPSMTRRFRLPFLGDYEVPSQMVLESRNAIDWVADPRSAVGAASVVATDNVRVMPPEQVLTNLEALRADDEWWWLAYEGLWGAPEPLPFFGGSGPRGPRLQGVKWDNPFTWVMRECIADELPYWLEIFSRWQGVEAVAEPGGVEAATPS